MTCRILSRDRYLRNSCLLSYNGSFTLCSFFCLTQTVSQNELWDPRTNYPVFEKAIGIVLLKGGGPVRPVRLQVYNTEGVRSFTFCTYLVLQIFEARRLRNQLHAKLVSKYLQRTGSHSEQHSNKWSLRVGDRPPCLPPVCM